MRQSEKLMKYDISTFLLYSIFFTSYSYILYSNIRDYLSHIHTILKIHKNHNSFFFDCIELSDRSSTNGSSKKESKIFRYIHPNFTYHSVNKIGFMKLTEDFKLSL